MNEEKDNVKDSILSLKNPAPLQEIDKIGAEYQALMKKTNSQFELMAITANAVHEMRQRLPNELITNLCRVKGSRIGFKTDERSAYGNKKEVKYSIDVFREVFIESALRGTRLVGNEFNVISYGYYCTKEGFQGLMMRHPLFSDISMEPGIPKREAKRAIVPYKATWKFGDKEECIDTQISVICNDYASDDAILGKAERKMRARMWSKSTGDSMPEGDANEVSLGSIGALPDSKTVTPEKGKMLEGIDDNEPTVEIGSESEEPEKMPTRGWRDAPEGKEAPKAVDALHLLCDEDEIPFDQLALYYKSGGRNTDINTEAGAIQAVKHWNDLLPSVKGFTLTLD